MNKFIMLLSGIGITYTYKIFIDELLGTPQFSTITVILIFYSSLVALSAISQMVNCKNEVLIITKYSNNMRSRLLSKIYNNNIQEKDNKEILFDYVKSTEGFISQSIDIIMLVLSLIVYFFLLMFHNWILTILILMFIPFSIMISAYLARRVRSLDRDYKKIFADYERDTSDILGNIKHVKSNNAEVFMQTKFKKNWDILNKLYVKQFFYWCLDISLFEIKEKIISRIMLFCVGGLLIIYGKMDVATLVVILSFNDKIIEGIVQLNELYLKGEIEKIALDRILVVLNRDEPIQSIDLENSELSILVDNLSYSYESKQVLEKINLEMGKYGIYSIVGESGSGKTTLVNLLLKILELKQGNIRIGNKDINKIPIHSLYKHIGVVTQDAVLFDMSIKENILISNPEADDELVLECCKRADLFNFVNELTNGWDTEIGERGVLLSGGQRQKIALARLFLKKPLIYVLDEATSNIDLEAEIIIRQSLNLLRETNLIIIISHRLTLVKDSDSIFVLKDGNILNRGSHAELSATSEEYIRVIAGKDLEVRQGGYYEYV
ncbi:ABC transporter ATP-binding protein [Paenibacillus borealis]|nr:ABC transporter ATP-binding protein [Paenibacillus borealis]